MHADVNCKLVFGSWRQRLALLRSIRPLFKYRTSRTGFSSTFMPIWVHAWSPSVDSNCCYSMATEVDHGGFQGHSQGSSSLCPYARQASARDFTRSPLAGRSLLWCGIEPSDLVGVTILLTTSHWSVEPKPPPALPGDRTQDLHF